MPSVEHKSGVTPRLRLLIDESGGQSSFARRVWGEVEPNKGKIRKWYHGHSGISHGEARVVADKCGRSLEWLLTGRETAADEDASEADTPDPMFEAFLKAFPAAAGLDVRAAAARAWYYAQGRFASGGHTSHGREITQRDQIAAAKAVGEALHASLVALKVKPEAVSPWQLRQFVTLTLAAFETILIGTGDVAFRRLRVTITPRPRMKHGKKA